jgi:AcrR family transcriptional regulator
MPTTLTGRDLVLDQAARLFLESGYVETTLRDIATACDVKAGSIYYHFESKANILSHILDIGIERITEGTTEAIAANADSSPGGALRSAIQGHLEALFEHGPYTAAHVSVFQSAPRDVRELGIVRRDADDLLKAGDLRPGTDLRVARIALFGAMNSTLDWFQLGGSRTLAEVADDVADLFLLGVVAR